MRERLGRRAATFGFTSEQLIKFGINPRPRVTRRRAAEPDVNPTPAAE